jgi:hypothetical protein
MLDLLIGREEVAAVAQLSSNTKISTLQTHILNAQNIDCKQVLGNAAWTDLIKNKDEEKYQDLLNGKEYEYNGQTLSFVGLKYAIANYTFARYLLQKNVNDASFGAVVKTTDVSEPADAKSIAIQVAEKKSVGQMYLNECVAFMSAFPEVYDIYNGQFQKPSASPKGVASIHFVDRYKEQL